MLQTEFASVLYSCDFVAFEHLLDHATPKIARPKCVRKNEARESGLFFARSHFLILFPPARDETSAEFHATGDRCPFVLTVKTLRRLLDITGEMVTSGRHARVNFFILTVFWGESTHSTSRKKGARQSHPKDWNLLSNQHFLEYFDEIFMLVTLE